MDILFLQKTMLFNGMNDDEISESLHVLDSKEKAYKKGAFIMHAGDTTDRFGLVISGSVTVESCDYMGSRTILAHIGSGQLFAETYAILGNEPMLVDVVANEDCRILFLNAANMKKTGSEKLVSNLLIISSRKNLALSGRSFHTAPKNIRARVMSYLNSVSLKERSLSFRIPFDRQQLADYLNVERSALSKELGKMRDEGIIVFRKDHFEILV